MDKKTTVLEQEPNQQEGAQKDAPAPAADGASTDQITQELARTKDMLCRLSADFENYKRREAKDRESWQIAIRVGILEKILPFIDDFGRALAQSADQATTSEQRAWLEGFELVYKNALKTLRDMGVEEIAGTGAFDPQYHEALMHVDAKSVPSGHIVQVLRKGYMLHGQVITHAQVSVAR